VVAALARRCAVSRWHVLCLLAAATAIGGGGCGTGPRPLSGAPQRAGWDPGYWSQVVSYIRFETDWRRELTSQLAYRCKFETFWDLIRLVQAHAPGAEYVAVAERIPDRKNDDGHWFGLIALKPEGAWVYSAGPFPVYPTELKGHGQAVATDVPHLAWGRIAEKHEEEVRRYFRRLEAINAWDAHYSERILGPSIAGPGDVGGWIVHIWRREDRKAATFAIEDPIMRYSWLEMDVIVGNRGLETMAKESRELDKRLGRRIDWMNMGSESPGMIRRWFSECYCARVARTGALRIIYRLSPKQSGKPVAGDIRPNGGNR
jgi:hypothetical protein